MRSVAALLHDGKDGAKDVAAPSAGGAALTNFIV